MPAVPATQNFQPVNPQPGRKPIAYGCSIRKNTFVNAGLTGMVS